MTYELPSRMELLQGRVVVDPRELIVRSLATDRDVVVLSGTLLEGIGNLYSDLDLYVISDQLPVAGNNTPGARVIREDGRVRRAQETLSSSDNMLLDIQYYSFHELETLARSLRTLYFESRQTSRIYRKNLHHEDEDLIHKLLIGRILQDGTGRFDIHATFDATMFRFLKYRNEVGGYEEFRDLLGSWTAGDLDSCIYNIRGYLVAQVSGMMFLEGSTNPRSKWFMRRLAALPAEYSDVRDGVLSWMHCAHQTSQQKRAAVESACDLIDAAHKHVRRLLGTDPKFFSVTEALELSEREFESRATRDEDAFTELRFRRRLYSDVDAPLMMAFDKRSLAQHRAVAGHAPAR